MLSIGERLCDQITPRQVVLLTEEIKVPSTQMFCGVGLVNENSWSSNLSVFSRRPLSLVNFVTMEACCSKRAIFGVILLRSSACPREPRYRPLIRAPVPDDSKSTRRESITSRNSSGDRTDPCFTPRFKWKLSESLVPRRTQATTSS